mgnify:CR=1 FL=1
MVNKDINVFYTNREDSIEINRIKLNEVKQFNYDGNDHEPLVKGRNTMGVNGEMILKFSVPTYMWLLENL